MQGVVIPKLGSDDDLPSLMSDNGIDIQIVEAMLKENTGDNFHYDPDAEVDDSSEKDKDFLLQLLFGRLNTNRPFLLRCRHQGQ